MQADQSNISLIAVKLMIGFFSSTNTEAEKDALDDWINMNDTNMRIFEECLEITMRPKQPHPDLTEDDHSLWVAAELLLKHRQVRITVEEKEALDDWLSISGQNKQLLSDIPATNDQKVIYNWLVKRLVDDQEKRSLN